MKKDCGLCQRYGHGCHYHPDQKGDKNQEPKLGNICGLPKTNRDPCHNPAGKGTDHLGHGPCWLHGGMLPSVRKKWQKERALEELATYGLPRDVDPHTALLEEIARTAGHGAWLERKVRDHDNDDDLIWGLTKDVIGGKDQGITSEAKPSVWLQLYQKERAHLVDVCRVAIAVGIAEREVRIAEGQGLLIAQVIRGVLSELNIDDRPQVEKIVRHQLMLVGTRKDPS